MNLTEFSTYKSADYICIVYEVVLQRFTFIREEMYTYSGTRVGYKYFYKFMWCQIYCVYACLNDLGTNLFASTLLNESQCFHSS